MRNVYLFLTHSYIHLEYPAITGDASIYIYNNGQAEYLSYSMSISIVRKVAHKHMIKTH